MKYNLCIFARSVMIQTQRGKISQVYLALAADCASRPLLKAGQLCFAMSLADSFGAVKMRQEA